jgi:hypothetical protein
VLFKKTENKQTKKMAKRVTIKNPNDFEEIVVNGCIISPDTVYEIVPKEPSDKAPEIYHQMGSTKERMPGVSNTVSLTQSDTGFFSGSSVFNKTEYRNDWTKRDELAQKYYDIFAAPMKIYISEIERIKIPTDNEFFDRNYPEGFFTVNIGEGAQFNTANPIDRFKLYIAIIEGELVMKGKRTEEEKEAGLKDEGDMFHQDAQYAYVSITERKNKKEQTAEMEMEAAYEFGQLLREKTDILKNMLSYINLPVKKDTSKAEMNSLYKTKVESDKNKLKDFIELLRYYQTNEKELLLEFDILDKLKSKKGREIIKKEGSTYYLGESVLGSNHKSIVATLIKRENEELLKEFNFQLDS